MDYIRSKCKQTNLTCGKEIFVKDFIKDNYANSNPVSTCKSKLKTFFLPLY